MRSRFATALIAGATLGLLAFACAHGESPPPNHPPGKPTTIESKVLETGARTLQGFLPVKQVDVYLDGLHVMKDRPDLFLEAHHYCSVKSEDFMQCMIFDGNTSDANLVGIEYIISERLFDGLPSEERGLWHPHNYEILSGQLVAPGVPEVAEKELMKKKINSYGKTWHVWDTGHFGHARGEPLPIGMPLLAWSLNADGEAPAQLLAERDKRLGISTDERRRNRADLQSLAHPQEGVDDLAKHFPNRSVPPFVRAR